jgi:5-bromo-4-chloroindolyl phosphate hydrolysis protein
MTMNLEPWHLGLAILGFLGGVGAFVFAAGRIVGRVEAVAQEMQKAMSEWKDDRKQLATLALHEKDITTIKDSLIAATKRVDELWRKVFSHDKHIAVIRAQSSHDIIVNDTDPPPRGE